MANDGTAGIRAIKAEGGITFAQDETALFQSMPQNAINSGFVDFILSPEEMAKELTALVKVPYILLLPEKVLETDKTLLKKIHTLVFNKRGIDFSHYKQTTITRRILRRMTLNRCNDLQQYIKLLTENENEVEVLYHDLLINVTSFFRDPQLYLSLSQKVFSLLVKDRKMTDPLRIWIPACSTGEEACTYAICLFEFLGERALTVPIQIFATDLSEPAIDKARTGIYARSSLSNVPEKWLNKYFTKLDGHYQVVKPIRDICIFATHNLLKDPPFSRMDIISCQNVMIYLEQAPQKRILNAFHYALKPNGYLILGKSETIGSATELFEQADKELKIYTRKATTANFHFNFPSRLTQFNVDLPEQKKAMPKLVNELDIDKEIDRILLSRYVPGIVVINKDLHIVRFHGSTYNFLQPASGKASFHLLKMVRDEILFELRTLIHKVKKEGRSNEKSHIQLTTAGITTEVAIEVVPVKSLHEIYYLVVFKETPLNRANEQSNQYQQTTRDAKTQRINGLEQELRESRDHMKTMNEEFEAVKEELQSANEEILSSNEELQSINEELETSKEELQSSNEELTTINDELQHRNTDLKEAVDYTKAIVQTIREPLLVLGADMRVRTANKAFYETFKLSADTTEGHLLHEIGNGAFNIDELRSHLAEVIAVNTSFENMELTTKLEPFAGRVLMCSAIRMEQEDRKNQRILLSIEDITNRKKEENTLKNNEERFRLLVQNAFEMLVIFSKDGVIQFLSGAVERILGYTPEERLGINFFDDPISHPADREIRSQMFKNAVEHPHTNIKTEFRILNKNGNYVILEAVCINLLDNPSVNGIVCNYRDVTQRRMLEKQKEEFLAIASHELKTPVTSIKGYTEILIENFEDTNDTVSVELVRKLDRQVDRLTDLIKDLLDVTKITEGQLELQKNHFDINELIRSVALDLNYVSGKRVFELKLAKVKEIRADKERIRQVLINLISNAIKYSPASDKIVVSTANVKQGLKVCVIDYGIGLPKEAQSKVFERFFRVNDKDNHTFPGLGLGLFISAEIIKRHNGTISVKSEKNKGAEFCFVIPFGSEK